MAYTQIQKLSSPSPVIDNNYGSYVIIEGYHAVVSELNGSKVWLYKRDLSGSWESRISGGIAVAADSLSINGDHIVAGDSTAGSIYIYNKDVTSDTSLGSFGPVAGEDYGSSVAISENYIVVGAPARNSNEGAIYIYEKTGANSWTAYSENPITADSGSSNDFFGTSVATNDTSIIVGAIGDKDRKGTVYIFQKDSETEEWEQTQKLFSSDGESGDEFGGSISVSGNELVVGARFKDSSTDVNSGAAYIFKYVNNWSEIGKLVGIDEDDYEGNRFGQSVYINEDYIIVGSPKARGTGVADIFYKKRSWEHLKKILGDDSASSDDFGNSVSISGSFAIIGSLENSEFVSDGGAAYIYEDPQVTLRLAQEFEVDGQYVPSKASVYLKKIGNNENNYWSIYNTSKTVIDATNFSTIDKATDSPGISHNFEEIKKLIASDAEDDDELGWAVSVDGDYAVVGAYKEDGGGTDRGAAYVYYKDEGGADNWGQIKKLVASSKGDNYQFGRSVSIKGDYIFVGSPLDSSIGALEGSVYIFNKDCGGFSNWGETQKITASDAEVNGAFGWSVSVGEDYAVIGSLLKNNGGSFRGEAYIFFKDESNPSNEWQELKSLTPSDSEDGDSFGGSVFIDGDYIIVGSPGKDNEGSNQGAAYLYCKDCGGSSNWGEMQKIISSDISDDDAFGGAVSINGDNIIVGAYGAGSALRVGAAYIFDRSGQGPSNEWQEVKIIPNTNNQIEDRFGWSVSVYGNYAIVGSVFVDAISILNSGAAYVYYKDEGGVNNWGVVKTLLPEDIESGDSFGLAVSIDEGNILIGAPKEDGEGTNRGSAYVFSVETVFTGSNIIKLDDEFSGFTGNGYMIVYDKSYPPSDFGVINYPIRAVVSDTFDLWIRYLVPMSGIFEAEILIDGNLSKTINETTIDPSHADWEWVRVTLVLPDNREHILGIKIKENEASIDKLYIEKDSSTPYLEGPYYTDSPYLTIHMLLYDSDSNRTPGSQLFVYDYKNSITEVVQTDWYNFNIKVLDDSHGYLSASNFEDYFYMVMSTSGSRPENFVVWETINSDEYVDSPSAIKF
jgi:hypothetical protein